MKREIKDLEKKIELIEKTDKSTSANPCRASNPKVKRKLPLIETGTGASGSSLAKPTQRNHPALSPVSPKSKDNQRKRKLFSINSNYTDF